MVPDMSFTVSMQQALVSLATQIVDAMKVNIVQMPNSFFFFFSPFLPSTGHCPKN